jgi:ribonuclease P protein component
MLPRQNRIFKTREINEVYRRGRQVKTAHLKLFYFTKGNQGSPKFTFIVSKRQAARIVDRNRLKRIFRSEIASLLVKFPAGAKVIIQAQTGMPKIQAKLVREEIKQALLTAKLI